MSDKIFTVEDLVTKIDEDLSWRKKELYFIKTQIPKDKSPKQSAYLRLAIPLLYAHWEGLLNLQWKHISNLYHLNI